MSAYLVTRGLGRGGQGILVLSGLGLEPTGILPPGVPDFGIIWVTQDSFIIEVLDGSTITDTTDEGALVASQAVVQAIQDVLGASVRSCVGAWAVCSVEATSGPSFVPDSVSLVDWTPQTPIERVT